MLYDRALARLARREHSRAELARALARTRAPEETIAAVLDRLQAEGALDDGRYARERLRVLLARGHGPLRLRAELAQAGLERGLVDREVAALGPEVLAAARAFCRRRLGEGWERDPVRRDRARVLLARRGHDAGTVGRLLREDDEGPPFEGQ